MHSSTPQLEPPLQSGLSTIMAGRNWRSLPWHCFVFWAHTPRNYGEADNQSGIGCPLKANISSKLQLVVAVAAPGDFVAACQHLKRDLWAEKSPAQPQSQSQPLPQRQPQRQTAVFISHFHPTVLYVYIERQLCVYVYRDEPLTALWKTSMSGKFQINEPQTLFSGLAGSVAVARVVNCFTFDQLQPQLYGSRLQYLLKAVHD